MMSTLFTCFVIMAASVLTSVCPEDSNPACEDICDKYRTSDDAFTVHCKDHRYDWNCQNSCGSCPDICTEHPDTQVYSCPQIVEITSSTKKLAKPDKESYPSTGNSFANSTAYQILAYVVAILTSICIFGLVIWGCYTRIRRGQIPCMDL